MYPYDPDWAFSFERERARLTPILQPFLVHPLEHMGSTSVPGLVAKPIIDMLAVVGDISPVVSVEGSLREIGWVFAPEPADEVERMLSFCTPSEQLRTHHLHIVEESFVSWRGWLAFRNYLRKNPGVALEYGELKTRLSVEHGSDPNDRNAYRAGKADWVSAVTARALLSDRL
jgi:GrpB-like predicted nucleotidyltransferase (UPF0157 family)